MKIKVKKVKKFNKISEALDFGYEKQGYVEDLTVFYEEIIEITRIKDIEEIMEKEDAISFKVL
jgi:hypothetical protein